MQAAITRRSVAIPCAFALAFTMLFCVLPLGACRSGERAPSLSELAERHLDAFSRFEAWAQRAAIGADGFVRPDAFREAAFAPLREEDGVISAWIITSGPGARTFSLHEDAVFPALRWQRHPSVHAQGLELARAALSPRPGAALRDCVLLARSAGAEESKSTGTRVVVAFAIERQ